ncbi:MAG: hypothetical protein NTV44_05345, partial [Firmicutes bacterium]|nr:hypothetical protein [Bacillota bacterium]
VFAPTGILTSLMLVSLNQYAKVDTEAIERKISEAGISSNLRFFIMEYFYTRLSVIDGMIFSRTSIFYHGNTQCQ